MNRIIFKLSLLVAITVFLVACEEKASVTIKGELNQWNKVVFEFTGIETSEYAKENPFLNYRLYVNISDGKTTYKIPGYYAADGNAAETSADKGGVWRAIFRPDEIGEWNYEISFQKGKDLALFPDSVAGESLVLDGYTGTLMINESTNYKDENNLKAKGRIVNGGSGYFRFQNTNEIFIKNGTDSPENFLAYVDFDQTKRYLNKVWRDGEANADAELHAYELHVQDWDEGDPVWQGQKGKGMIGAINYLSGMGLNSIYMLSLNILGDGKDVWPYSDHNERYRFDCSKLDQWEIVFDHMEAKGMMIQMVLQETENECLLDNGYTEQQRKLYLKELSARFGHHLGIIWNLGEENGAASWTPIGQTDAQRKSMASYLKEINPYHPIVFLHTHADDHGQDQYLTPLLGFDDLDGASMQIGNPSKVNERIRKWIDESQNSDHRWIVNMDELGPHWKGVMPDSFDENHDTIRAEALWGALMAGAGGVEWYFGWKYPHADLGCEDFRSRHNWWKQSTIATQFLNGFNWSDMKACNHIINRKDAYAISDGEEFAIVYLPSLKGNEEIRPDFAAHQVKWFNPRAGGEMLPCDFTIENNVVTIRKQAMEGDKDWALIVMK